MIHYVVGFCFDETGENVVLIRKNKPVWQAGRYNGVGGKIEKGEIGLDAMLREFKEETGYWSDIMKWEKFGKMIGQDWSCELFYTFDQLAFISAKTTTDESIERFNTAYLPSVISNLRWLIPAARNHKENRQEFYLEVHYK